MLSKAMLLMQRSKQTPVLTRISQQKLGLVQTQAANFGLFANHRDSEDNLDETPFEFTKESYEQIDILLTKYPSNYKASAVIPVLFIAQKQNDNFLTLSAMNKTAKILEMTPMQVYEVASFFTMFNRFKVGKYHLQVCGTTPCMVRGVSSIRILMFILGWRSHQGSSGLHWRSCIKRDNSRRNVHFPRSRMPWSLCKCSYDSSKQRMVL